MLDDYEEFTDAQVKILERFVTSTTSPVFCLRNLPEVIKGALFSRYSRSSLGLRSLLLKEFISKSEDTEFDAIVGKNGDAGDPMEQVVAIKKAQSFYDRILDGYGDDSIGELGGAHMAVENVSMLAAKFIEDCRIGGSPLEKSTRYIYFDQKVKGDYLFYREPILMTSAYRDAYVDTCNMLFETYSRLIPPMTEWMEERFPKDPEASKVAYTAALRAKVLDTLRGLLPAGTLTNMGVFGNGRFFETLQKKLHSNNLAEMQEIGKRGQEELAKVIPSFIRRADMEHRHYQSYAEYMESMNCELDAVNERYAPSTEPLSEQGVKLIDYDRDGVAKVAAAMLYGRTGQSLGQLLEHTRQLPEEDLARILDAGCSARSNRRHKSPRALEHAEFVFDILADFGAYRDLHRHRILTQERQLLTCDYGYYVPAELIGSPMEADYVAAMTQAKEVFDVMRQALPEEAQYVVPMGYNIRWYFKVNLRALQWMTELRSAPAGHPSYRYIAQQMSSEIIKVLPIFERFLKFVDYDGYELGRLGQEQHKADKASGAPA